ncbi:MAG: isoprenylcysteine carboxylmethyltransferase family protein [Bacteroidota bacterium]|nr:isoprenylcysteine carboxylmethyltransferase family protein [Bacteroidota bacterium]MDP4233943.1 isoprenylcysteine carboxylmethyltransferase family protein [Bacteroidota bacterium]MDP4242806.1 isoprenylcysteine carboxylmethyltransferase family protein [Bacteroidota bacterium]MDP4288520.1 isoprenylcysteine carboxylmethyltransferase family protein [Bacteroidota bacterium]
MVSELFIFLVGGLIIERLLELRASRRNMANLFARGGRERSGGHYPVIVAMHISFFFSIITEYLVHGGQLPDYWWAAVIVFVLAQLLRLWSRLVLGERWTARIVIVPGQPLIASGPYRFLPHPIYIAVALELLSLPLIFGLCFTAIVFTVLNAMMLLLVRIPAERRALFEK